LKKEGLLEKFKPMWDGKTVYPHPLPPKDIHSLRMKFGTFTTTATRNEFFCHLDEYLIQSKIKATLLTDTIGFQFLVPGTPLDLEDPKPTTPCLVHVEMHNVAESEHSIVRFRCASGNTMDFAQFYRAVYASVLKNYDDSTF
jgi:hypothetical protein